MFRKVHLFTVKDREEAQMVADTIGEQLVNLHHIRIGPEDFRLLNNMEQVAVERSQMHLAYRLPHFDRCEILYPKGVEPYQPGWADLSEITHVNLFRFARHGETEETRPARLTYMATSSWIVVNGEIRIVRGPNFMRAEKVWNKAYFDSIHDTRPARLRWRLENFEQMAVEEFLGIEDAEPTVVQRPSCSRRLYVCDEAGAEALSSVAMYPIRSIFDHPCMRKGWAEIPDDRDITFEEFNDLLTETIKGAFTGEPYCWYIPAVFDHGAIFIQLDGRYVGASCFVHRAMLYADMCAYVKGVSFTLMKTKLLGSGMVFRIDRKAAYRPSKPVILYKKRHDEPWGGFRITPEQLGVRFVDPAEVIARGLDDRSGLHMTDNRSIRALARFGEYSEHLGVNAVLNIDGTHRIDAKEQLMVCAELVLSVSTNVEWEKTFTYAVQLPDCALKSADGSYDCDTSRLRPDRKPHFPYDPAEPLEDNQ